MPRVCARENCGKRLVRKDGTPDYHRHFCGSHCKNADKRERMQEKRQHAKAGPCPLCGSKRSNDSPGQRCAASQADLRG
jgi:endogenous inhibitor of DNA gyrase (YacG/DUF329 family)